MDILFFYPVVTEILALVHHMPKKYEIAIMFYRKASIAVSTQLSATKRTRLCHWEAHLICAAVVTFSDLQEQNGQSC